MTARRSAALQGLLLRVSGDPGLSLAKTASNTVWAAPRPGRRCLPSRPSPTSRRDVTHLQRALWLASRSMGSRSHAVV